MARSKKVSEGSATKFEPHPTGQFPALCIDIVDVGWRPSRYGPKYKYRLVFFCGEWTMRVVDGEEKKFPMLVMGQFTATLSDRGRLRPFLESWRGQPFSKDELQEFDVEKLYRVPAFLHIVHNKSGDNVYANIQTIMRLPEAMTAPEPPADYIRVEDRPDWKGPEPHPDMSTPTDAGSGQAPGPDPEPNMTEPQDDLPF